MSFRNKFYQSYRPAVLEANERINSWDREKDIIKRILGEVKRQLPDWHCEVVGVEEGFGSVSLKEMINATGVLDKQIESLTGGVLSFSINHLGFIIVTMKPPIVEDDAEDTITLTNFDRSHFNSMDSTRVFELVCGYVETFIEALAGWYRTGNFEVQQEASYSIR